MDKKTPIQDGKNDSPLQLPLGQLFYLLYNNGFSVKPDDYIEMLKITERFGSQDIDETARWICPIIATSEMEQTKFYNIIEQYKKITAVKEDEAAARKRKQQLLKIAIATVAALLLFLVMYLSLSKRLYNVPNSRIEKFIEKGTRIDFDAADLLQAPEDSADLQFSWQFEDGRTAKGQRASHLFSVPGDHYVKRLIRSNTFSLSKNTDSLLVHVCNDLPALHIILPGQTVTAKKPITLTATVDAEPGTVSKYEWTVKAAAKDSIFTTQQPRVENLVFPNEGDFGITCKAVVGTVNSPCTVTDQVTISVLDNGMHYSASFSNPGPGSYEGKTRLKWWASLLFLLPAAACAAYSLFKRKTKKTALQQKTNAAETSKQGPFDIPFEQNDIKLIQQDRELRRTFIQMRYRAEEETLVLSIPATINSTIQSGGSPQLVYAPLTQQQQYLVLIDRTNTKSMLTRLFSWLVKSIAEDGIPVAIFYYDKHLVCYNETFPGGLTLQRLAETHTNDTLIMMGKAHELVYSAYPVIEEKFLRELNRWQSKAIITPVPVKDWSAKEKILLQYLILLPADTSSLQKLMPALREKIKPNTSLLEITNAESYTLKETDFQDLASLRSYLNNDETIFQWLCAACIYPRLSWEILVEMGKTILDKYGEPEKLNYGSLLRLCRITWMQQGVFPQITRLELLKSLTVENEICAREKLLEMLEYSTKLYGESGCFFEEEKKRQQLTNQFILHASNKDQFERYAHSKEAFQEIWKKDAILDVPLKKYLEKSEKDKWQTPVNNGQQSVGLTVYFNQEEKAAKKTTRLRRGLAAVTAVLLLALWVYMAYGGGAKKLEPLVFLGQQANPPTLPIAVKVIKLFSACGDTLQRNFNQLDGYLELSNEKFPLTWDEKTATATFDGIPYDYLLAGKASITLSWAQNKSVTSPLVFTNRLFPDSVTIACQNRNIENKKPLYIRYNDTTGYRDIENVLLNALFEYNISALQSDFTDSSRIIYYEPNQKPRADSIVDIMAQTMGIHVAEDFISEQRTPAAAPILFINTAKDSTKDKTTDDTKANARDHHLMGDQHYTDGKYQAALDEYTEAIRLDPADALAYYNRGLCYEALANGFSNKSNRSLNTPLLEKALKEYNAAIALNAKDGLSWYRKASIKYSLKRYADAIPDYNRVININSSEMKRQVPLCIYFRGKCYYFLKDLTRACEDFKKSGDMGVNAGKQDYAANCGKPADPLPDDNKGNQPPVISNQTERDFGYIELDQKGYTDATGQQIIQQVSGLLKAQPASKVRLTGLYATEEEQKMISGYMNTIANMLAKIGVNSKTQIEQRMERNADQAQQQNQNNEPAARSNKMRIRVTGINLNDIRRSTKKA